jgi:hypothetical protein
VFNWRILLGGAASAAILTVGVAAPAFAVPRASTPVSPNGITGSQVGEIFCALPNLPEFAGVTAAAGAVGESCGGSTQVNGSSQSLVPGLQQGSEPQAGGQANGQANGSAPADGSATAAGASTASGALTALPGLNSISGSIPDLSHAASVVPGLSNMIGSVTVGNSSLGGAADPGSVTGTVRGVAGGLSGVVPVGAPVP